MRKGYWQTENFSTHTYVQTFIFTAKSCLFCLFHSMKLDGKIKAYKAVVKHLLWPLPAPHSRFHPNKNVIYLHITTLCNLLTNKDLGLVQIIISFLMQTRFNLGALQLYLHSLCARPFILKKGSLSSILISARPYLFMKMLES